MGLNKAMLDSLISQYAHKDTNLMMILQQLSQDLDTVTNIVIPVQAQITSLGVDEPVPGKVPTIIYELFPTSVRFTWDAPDTIARLYELRVGDPWETANHVLRTQSTTADINPITVGTHRYQIKALNAEFEESDEASFIDVIIPPLGLITLSVVTIDNNVLLNWTVPTSTFQISHYIVSKKRGADPYTEIGRIGGNFLATFETVSDEYTYKVEPVDIAGNVGTAATVTKTVAKPPDFELLTDFTSDLNGDRINVVRYLESDGSPRLLGPVNDLETYEEHFTVGAHAGKPWDTPQEQVDNSFPIYIQPGDSPGQYDETVDLGTIIQNVVINLSLSQETIAGSVTISVSMAGSEDGVTYSAFSGGTSAFFSSVQYVKIRIVFTATDDTGLAIVYNLHGTVDVKREVDSGEVLALEEDLDGTFVPFNKVFKDVDSVTATAESKQPLEVVARFSDVPNPTGFRALVFDSAGRRITYRAFWKARGIV